IIASVEDAQNVLDRELPGNFAKLRAALKPLVGGNLSRVVYVTYGNPALAGPAKPCPGGRDGFDVRPAFAVDGERLRQTVEFVAKRFLPGVRALATCDDGRSCRNPSTDRMTFVDAHQAAFVSHGACARAADDPAFDRECFSGKGETFESSLTKGAMEPMACGYPASEFRPYASRARWIRTANDSYFTAMTYPEGLPAVLHPSHGPHATWGVFAAGHGGASPSALGWPCPAARRGRAAAGRARGARLAAAGRPRAERAVAGAGGTARCACSGAADIGAVGFSTVAPSLTPRRASSAGSWMRSCIGR